MSNNIIIAFHSSLGLDVTPRVPVVNYNGKRFTLHFSPIMSTSYCGGYETNYDVVAGSAVPPQWYNNLPNSVIQPRYSKIQQAVVVRDAVSKLGLWEHYRDALAFGGYEPNHDSSATIRPPVVSIVTANPIDIDDLRDGLVFKPNIGSSSVGLRVVKPIDPDGVMATPDKISHALLEGEVTDECKEKLKALGWELIHYTDMKEKVRKVPSILVPDIKAEFRIITVDGKIRFQHQRTRAKGKYGWETVRSAPDRPLTNTCEESMRAFPSRLKAVGMKVKQIKDIFMLIEYLSHHHTPLFGSYDLFITENGEWGLFEFSYQSGSHDLTTKQTHELTGMLCEAIVSNLSRNNTEIINPAAFTSPK